jgi:hypothetical protein
MMVYYNSGYYPSSCLLFKTQPNSIGLSLKLNSTQLYRFVRTSQATLRLLYEPTMLMLSIGLLGWYINITITILDIIHHLVFYLKLNSTL